MSQDRIGGVKIRRAEITVMDVPRLQRAMQFVETVRRATTESICAQGVEEDSGLHELEADLEVLRVAVKLMIAGLEGDEGASEAAVADEVEGSEALSEIDDSECQIPANFHSGKHFPAVGFPDKVWSELSALFSQYEQTKAGKRESGLIRGQKILVGLLMSQAGEFVSSAELAERSGFSVQHVYYLCRQCATKWISRYGYSIDMRKRRFRLKRFE